MKAWLNSWKRRKGLDVEAVLRANRPRPDERLVRSIARRVDSRPSPVVRGRVRLGAVGVLAAASFAVLGATGGFSYAASSLTSAVRATEQVAHLSSSVRLGSRSSASAQYVEPPTISGNHPTHGTVKTVVTVTGTHLATVSGATVNGHGALIKKGTDTSFSLTVPTTATGTGVISVTTKGGTGSGGSFTVDATPTATFHSGQQTTDLEPGMTVVIDGTNLDDITSATFGTVKASISNQSSTSLTLTVPAGLRDGSTNPVNLIFPNGTISPGSITASTGPVIKSFSPPTMVADGSATMTLKGSGFDKTADTVTIQGHTAANIGAWDSTQAFVTIPAGITGQGDVVITDGDGISNGGQFTPILTPNPTGASPSLNGAGGTIAGVFGLTPDSKKTVTITGTHFWGVTSVKFQSTTTANAIGRATANAAGTSLTVTVPANAADGKVSVINAAAPNGVQLNSPTYFRVTKPVFATPEFTQTGSSVVLHASSGFDGVTGVTLGKVTVSTFTVVSDSEIDFSVPTDAPAGTVTVVNAASKATTKGSIVGVPVIKSAKIATKAGVTTVTIIGTSLQGTNSSATVTAGGHSVTLTGTQTSTKLVGTVTGLTSKSIVSVTVDTNVGPTATKSGVKVP